MYIKKSAPEDKRVARRTCSALRRGLAFPPHVVLIIVIEFAILVSLPVVVSGIVVVFIIIILVHVVLRPTSTCAAAAARFLSRGRRHGVVPRCAADRRTGVAYAVWAEPLAVWNCGEGGIEARVVVRVIALRFYFYFSSVRASSSPLPRTLSHASGSPLS